MTTSQAHDRPTGPELAQQLRTAAAAKGVPIKEFVAPLITSTAQNLLKQLSSAQIPTKLTIERVTACIEGRPVPPPRPATFTGMHGSKRHETRESERGWNSDEVNRRRREVDRAHAERRPGETLHSALQRIQQEIEDNG